MKKTALAFAVGSALILAGCDGTSSPAGAGAGTSETNSSGVSDALAREKALTVARQNGTAMEVQLAGLIIEAVQELRPRWKGQFDTGLDNTICALGWQPERQDEARKVLEDQSGLPIIPGMELGVFVTGKQADFNAACLASYWPKAVEPHSGWGRTQAKKWSREATNEMANWASNQLAGVMATSATMAPIANSLAAMPGATVEQLKQRARELLLANANDYRQRFADVLKQYAGRGNEVTLDFGANQPAPVHFMLADLDVQMGPAGALISHQGTTRFGSGYLESVRYTVEAVNTSGQSMTRSSTRTTTSDSTNTNTVNAEARTQ